MEWANKKPPKEWEWGYKAGYRTALEGAAKVAETYIRGGNEEALAHKIAAAIRALAQKDEGE